MAETKKVIATVSIWNTNAKNGWLVANDVSPNIFINLAILQQKKSTNLNPKKGDQFEVEIQPSMYKGKPSWTILSIKAIARKLILENFALKLHKEQIFDSTNFKIENRILKKRGQDCQVAFGDNKDDAVKKYYQNFIARHHHNALQLTGGNLLPKSYDSNQKNELQFQPDWRLVVGLGSGSVFETSITLHHIYGFPYIPASAVKGVLRSYLITTLQGNKADSEALLFHHSKEMCDIFGCGEETIYEENGQKKRMTTYYKRCYNEDRQKFGKDTSKYRYPETTEKTGDVIFFDAYPTHSPQGCIKADIMNPHYPEYYGGNKPPADWQSPVPIIFLTVENLTFQFMVGLPKGVENQHIKLGNKSDDMLTVVSDYLKEALTQRGIGAKTAVGYGYMK
ncbi:MAG: type III-B CRISPR module RAMP protein Cmr6 [Thermaurantimonas sp.]|uniref:type III-B CRISPR module RAMP protein Cmr6 n=1 Tax=Thermaurantimonas sp. TaxID=2681568 RepID=UPI00391AC7ED